MSSENILAFFSGMSDQTLIAVAGVIVIIALIAFQYLLSRHRFKMQIRRSAEDSEAASAVMRRLDSRPSPALVRRILEYIPDRALFTIFLSALDKEKIARELMRWIEASDDMFVYRRLALSGKGEEFDGRKAREIFSDHLDRIREITGDPEWPARYMAVKILIYDDDMRSRRALDDMFNDPHTLIRRTLIEEYPVDRPQTGDELSDKQSGDDENTLYTRLLKFVTDDPAYEVRRTAKRRLMKDFADVYEIDYQSLESEQILHLIEQYDPESTEDINSALGFLEEDNLELRFAAGQFLDRSGSLEKLFSEVDFAERSQIEQNRKLLEKAVEVSCDNFLASLKETDNGASLTIAAGILAEYGDEELIAPLADKVFSRNADLPDEKRLLEQTLHCIKLRGPEKAIIRLTEDIHLRRYEDDEELFLDHLTGSYPFVVIPELKELLKDPDFTFREKLHEVFLRIDSSYYIDELFSILKSEREVYSHSVRISALLLLGKLKLSYCMQFLLEQMPVLPFEEARDFSVHLKKYDGKLFQKRVLDLLDKSDGKVKASLISAVPATGVKDFLNPIRAAVGDADPEVRRASVWALLEYGDQRSIKSSLDLLRDPVERVRVDAARALGSKGKPSIVENFSEILSDENEVQSVKRAAVEGLAESSETKSVDILIEQLRDRPEVLHEETVDALARKNDKNLIKPLIAHLKDAGPELRDMITEAFKRMGADSEASLLELLREDIASLTPHITHVLEETGFIEHTVRKLNHREAQVRREAAEILSRIGTTSAFRGIVLAARDPDEDVRVLVTRALERLNTESGNEILEELKNDPDKRIRKYTLWAMERIRSKNSEDSDQSTRSDS